MIGLIPSSRGPDKLDRSVQGAVIGQGQRLHALTLRLSHQRFRRRAAVQQAEMGVNVEVDKLLRHRCSPPLARLRFPRRRVISSIGSVYTCEQEVGRLGILHDVALTFFTALGVVLGGSIVGSLAALVSLDSPVHTMIVIAKPIKLWAMVVALGGTFPTIQALDTGVWSGEFRLIVQHLALIISGFLGASIGYWLVMIVAGSK